MLTNMYNECTYGDMVTLKEYRTMLEMTKVEVARQLGVSHATVSRLEAGKQTASLELAKTIEEWSHGAVSRLEILYPAEFKTTRDILDYCKSMFLRVA